MNGQNEQTAGERIVVIDVPYASTLEEAAAALNEPCLRNYYLYRIVEWPNVGVRAFFNLKAPGEGRQAAQTPESKALQFLRENREMPLTQLVAAFKALRFPRSSTWIDDKRREIVQQERRLAV